MVSTRTLKVAAWVTCGLTASFALGGVALAAIVPTTTAQPVIDARGMGVVAFETFVYTALGLLGATVTSPQPRNPVGWLLALIPLALATMTFSDHVYLRAVRTTGDVVGFAAYAAWFASWLWIVAIVPAFTIFPLLFPTGRPQSPPWRPLVWVAALAGVVTWFGTAFIPGPIEHHTAAVNPLGIDSAVVEPIGIIGFAVLVPTAFAAIASVVVRFWCSTGVERQQLKWVAAAATLLPVAFAGMGLQADEPDAGYLSLLSGLLLVGVAVTVAMLRYRLYDLDVVVNRTLVYGALTATLAAAYANGVLLLQFVLNPLTERSELAVAGSTLAVAALFRPVRARIQGWVDRRFYRSRYDANQTLASFSGRLRDELNIEALGSDLRAVVRETVQPAHVSLWLKP